MPSIHVHLPMILRECIHVCLARACACVLDCVFGNSENVQTVYKICKLMYCAVVQMCVNIYDSIHVRFNHLCSFLPMKCDHKCVDEFHKISCNSYNILITQQ